MHPPRIIKISIFFLLYFFVSLNLVNATSDSAITSVTILIVCGDGNVEGLEICDPGSPPIFSENINGLDCTDFGFGEGNLNCESDCSAYDTYLCYDCDGIALEAGEECDGSNFGGNSCISFGFDEGTLICTIDCKISTANCVLRPQIGGGGGGTSGGGTGIVPSGFFPGSEVPVGETKVVVRGSSYPESDVHILLDGKVIGIVTTDTKADFYFETTEIPAGVAGFGFWSEDPVGLKSTLLSVTFRVTSGAVTNISGIYISPTIDVDKKSLARGEDINIFGSTMPDSNLKVFIHSDEEFIEATKSSGTGNWSLPFNTEPLSPDFHTAKALFEVDISGNLVKSGFSRSVSFHVGEDGDAQPCAEADLNGDGRVNLVDFSILLFFWGTDNECADQNSDGNVDLTDFSIMMFFWTG